jgi:hypothetical protein
VDFHDKDWWLGSPIAVKLAAPIGPVLSGNFHLSYWAVGLHDGIAFGIKKKKKKNLQLGGELPTLCVDRVRSLQYKRPGFALALVYRSWRPVGPLCRFDSGSCGQLPASAAPRVGRK